MSFLRRISEKYKSAYDEKAKELFPQIVYRAPDFMRAVTFLRNVSSIRDREAIYRALKTVFDAVKFEIFPSKEGYIDRDYEPKNYSKAHPKYSSVRTKDVGADVIKLGCFDIRRKYKQSVYEVSRHWYEEDVEHSEPAMGFAADHGPVRKWTSREKVNVGDSREEVDFSEIEYLCQGKVISGDSWLDRRILNQFAHEIFLKASADAEQFKKRRTGFEHP